MKRRNFLKSILALPLVPIELPRVFITYILPWRVFNVTVIYKRKHACKYVALKFIREDPQLINKVLKNLIAQTYHNRPRLHIAISYSIKDHWFVGFRANNRWYYEFVKNTDKINSAIRRIYEMQMR